MQPLWDMVCFVRRARVEMELGTTLAVAKLLHKAFGRRDICHHAFDTSIEIVKNGDHKVVVAMDLAFSREILKCSAFTNLNYFKPGLEHARATGKAVAALDEHFNETILFKSGVEHRAMKRHYHEMLKILSAELLEQKPRIHEYFRKRKPRIHTAVAFSGLFVRLVAGMMVAQLTGIPLRRALRAVSMRCNVFCNYFTQSRHLATNKAIEYLYANCERGEPKTPAGERQLLAESLLIMGMDPILGTVCASLVESTDADFVANVYRHCPTSFVLRTCSEPISLRGINFNPGDACYIGLAPSAREAEAGAYTGANTSLAFGVGSHMCIGKLLSLLLLEIVGEIVSTHFPGGFAARPEVHPDGAFLAFANGKGLQCSVCFKQGDRSVG